MKIERIYQNPGHTFHPVSVVVTHTEESKPRRDFLRDFCLPSLRGANPCEIILVTGPEGAAAKRNAGASIADREFLLFWDDDCLMSGSYFDALLVPLMGSEQFAFAYCDALEIVHPEAPEHPFSGVKLRKSNAWDHGKLRRGNYVSNMSVMRRQAFPGCDPTLLRLIDYDMWLTMADQGRVGLYVPGAFYHAYYLDRGITAGGVSYERALRAVRAKHPR